MDSKGFCYRVSKSQNEMKRLTFHKQIMQITIVYLNYIIIKSFQHLLQIKYNLTQNMLNRFYL